MILIVAVLAVAAVQRAPITSVPPLLPTLEADLGLTPTLAGATTSLPLVCFGVFAFATPFLIVRLGLERTMYAALLPLLVGLVLRSGGDAPAFFVGLVLVGSGIAVGNVLVPALIRARFPLKVAALMGAYTAMLQVSGAVGAATATPLYELFAGSWRLSLGVWALLAAAVLLLWIGADRRVRAPARTTPPAGLGLVVRRRLTWGITVFMGLQSLTFYTVLTWLPSQLGAAGLSPHAAGSLTGLFNILGLPGAFIAPRFATSRHATATVVGTFAAQAVGILLLLSDSLGAILGTVLCGLAQGSGFALALTFVADQRDHGDVPAVSALAQGVGYLLAAVGPILVGGLYAGSGGRWLAPNLVLVATTFALLAVGVWVGRRLRDDKAAPALA